MYRHRGYRSKLVQQWLKEHDNTIRMFYLPSYCLELNPDEFLNQDVKAHWGIKRLKNKAEMMKKLSSHLKMRQKQPDTSRILSKGAILNMQLKKPEILSAARNIIIDTPFIASFSIYYNKNLSIHA